MMAAALHRLIKKPTLRRVWPALAFALLLLGGAPRLLAQYPSVPSPEWGNSPMVAPEAPNIPVPNAAIMRKRIIALNQQRQKALVADTQKLVKLAAQLNAEINNSHQTQLTPAQLSKVAEIEKLAHSVREKMATPITLGRRFGSFPVLHPFPGP